MVANFRLGSTARRCTAVEMCQESLRFHHEATLCVLITDRIDRYLNLTARRLVRRPLSLYAGRAWNFPALCCFKIKLTSHQTFPCRVRASPSRFNCTERMRCTRLRKSFNSLLRLKIAQKLQGLCGYTWSAWIFESKNISKSSTFGTDRFCLNVCV